MIRQLLERQVRIIAVALIASSCAAKAPIEAQVCIDPDAKLATILPLLESQACLASGPLECDRLAREVQRLAAICPAHAPTLLATAVLAYQQQQPVKAQQILDDILSRPQRQPDAAVLRARIAIEEGNLTYAKRLIEHQLQLVPDHAGLHETYAAELYVEGKMIESAGELALASTIGAPRWRIAYHLGLIEESAGRIDAAIKLYDEALQGNPNWPAAESRVKALRARRPSR